MFVCFCLFIYLLTSYIGKLFKRASFITIITNVHNFYAEYEYSLKYENELKIDESIHHKQETKCACLKFSS